MINVKEVFKVSKPIIGLIHLKGDQDDDILKRAKKELDIYLEAGIDGILVENYYGNYYHMEMILEYIQSNYPDIIYGVNCLNCDQMGFELAIKYNAKFIQIDSVVGHLKPRDDYSMEAFLNLYRKRTDALIFGGVRFKYQPILSERSLEEDLIISKDRCDVVCVTQNATGEETSLAKIKEFRDILQDFPLFVAAGVTKENALKQLPYVDGAIIGSYFKDTYKDTGDVCLEHVQEMVAIFDEYRKGENND